MPRALLLLMLLAFVPSTASAAKPAVNVNILVIEAKKAKGKFDPRIEKIKKKIARGGYGSAAVRDELNHKNIQVGSSVTLEMPSRKQDLRVTLVEVKQKKITLKVEIRGMKFETTTEHSDGGMLLVAITKGEVAMMLGVTPTIQ